MIPLVDLQGAVPSIEAGDRDGGRPCPRERAVRAGAGCRGFRARVLRVLQRLPHGRRELRNERAARGLAGGGDWSGDEVITVPFTFVATVAAIEYAGAKPVFVDINPDDYTMNPSALERAITPRTKAVIPVHLFGQPADMDPINEIARRHGLIVIEDACQAHGAEYKGRRAGSLADIGCFSFYPGKNLGAYGEGGASVTSRADYADTMRLLRSWGERTRYEHSMRAFNYRMDGIQGAILGVKLKHLESWTEARRKLATTYRELLDGTPARAPKERPDVRHVYHVFAVRLEQRDRWRARLTEMGIQTGVHYPVPLHLQPAYRDLGYGVGDFPVSEAVSREVLSLPFFPEMTDQQVEEVGWRASRWAAERGRHYGVSP